VGRREIREAFVATVSLVTDLAGEVEDWATLPIPAADLPVANIKTLGGENNRELAAMGGMGQGWLRDYFIDIHADSNDDIDDVANAVEYAIANSEILTEMLNDIIIVGEELEASSGAEAVRYRLRQSWQVLQRVDAAAAATAAPTFDNIGISAGATAILFSFDTSRAAIARIRLRYSDEYYWSEWTPTTETSHQVWVGGLTAETTYSAKVQILPVSGLMQDFTAFTDGSLGPNYDTTAGDNPENPHE